MLRMMLRQDGPNRDAQFTAMLQEFAETYGGRAASLWDFQHIAEKHAGQKLDWFFDQWILGTGLPAYTADHKVEGNGTDLNVTGVVSQSGVPDGFQMPVPLYADGDYLGTVQVDASGGQFKFKVNKKPGQIVIDPEMTVLTAIPQ
jgi:aminopeptidase N